MESRGFSGYDDSKLTIHYAENVVLVVAELHLIIKVLPNKHLPILVTLKCITLIHTQTRTQFLKC
jgi:hypothetical protein